MKEVYIVVVDDFYFYVESIWSTKDLASKRLKQINKNAFEFDKSQHFIIKCPVDFAIGADACIPFLQELYEETKSNEFEKL